MTEHQQKTINRTFQVWEYQVSHGQLLIRSPKTPGTRTTAERKTNVDLVCLGVEYMSLPRVLHGVELLQPTSEELHQLELLLGRQIDPSSVKVLASKGKRFSVVASSFSISEHDWDIFESPLSLDRSFVAIVSVRL